MHLFRMSTLDNKKLGIQWYTNNVCPWKNPHLHHTVRLLPKDWRCPHSWWWYLSVRQSKFPQIRPGSLAKFHPDHFGISHPKITAAVTVPKEIGRDALPIRPTCQMKQHKHRTASRLLATTMVSCTDTEDSGSSMQYLEWSVKQTSCTKNSLVTCPFPKTYVWIS